MMVLVMIECWSGRLLVGVSEVVLVMMLMSLVAVTRERRRKRSSSCDGGDGSRLGVGLVIDNERQ